MDIGSYKYLPLATQILMPKGTRSVLDRFIEFAYEDVVDGDEKTIGDLRVTAMMSPHRAQRWSGMRFILALNYIIQTPDNKVIFYGTDSPYGPHFATFADRYKIDVAILPLDHVAPDFIAGKRYLDIPGALQAFSDLRATKMIPNAYGSFSFSGRRVESILEELRAEMFKRNLKDQVKVLQPGEAMNLEQS
jgi:L-ascorbate metabolism protein UlaG (beta-lactamase superfamily)